MKNQEVKIKSAHTDLDLLLCIYNDSFFFFRDTQLHNVIFFSARAPMALGLIRGRQCKGVCCDST